MGVEESMELDGLLEVENCCVRCNNGGSGSRKLLVCSEKGCPIALHEECMCGKPVFDQLGEFYCPYCAYKREFFRCRELRRKVMGSKSVLSEFIDAGEGEDCGCEEDGRGGGQVRGQSVGVEGGGAAEVGIEQRREIQDLRGGERIEEDQEEEEIVEETQEEDAEPREMTNNDNARDASDQRDEEDGIRMSEESEGESDDEEQEEEAEPQSGCSVREMTNKHNAHDGLLDQRDEEDGIRMSEENEGKSEDEEQMRSVEKEVPGNSTVVSESDELDTGSPLVRKKRFKKKSKMTEQPQNVASLRTVPSPSRESSSRQINSVEENAKNQNGKAKTFSKKERENQEFARNLVLPNGKRKRLKWTDEEIKMLKEGVRVYGRSNRKMQWKKILEYGHEVFHRTREPVDLKDKWRSLGKENKDNAHDGFDQRDEEDGIRLSEENEGESEDEEQMRSVEKEVPGKSTFDSESEKLDTGSPLVRSKQLKQKAKTKELPPNAKTFSKKEREIQESSRNLVLPNGKRKRLDWTDKEFKMLKEGVRLYGTSNGKIQWKEILEHGHNVFHITRQPVDLKDKWRRYFRKKDRKK